MSTLSVVVIVDAKNALATNDLQGNIWLADNGGGTETGPESNPNLTTVVEDQQSLTWVAIPTLPGTEVEIAEIPALTVNDLTVVDPKQLEPATPNTYWGAEVHSPAGLYQYTINLNIGGKKMAFKPFLKVVKAAHVLVVVDVEGALASKNLQDNVYMVDNNKHFGSGDEGTSELYTTVQNQELVTWAVTAIVPGNDVQISRFTGQAIDSGCITPGKKTTSTGEVYWEAYANTSGISSPQQYSMVLSFNGTEMTFDPFLKF